MSDHDEYADVLLYSDDATTRQAVMGAIGRRAGKGLPLIRWDETATADAVVTKVESKPYALLVLDGEAAKVGGMAVCRQLKQEIYDCPRHSKDGPAPGCLAGDVVLADGQRCRALRSHGAAAGGGVPALRELRVDEPTWPGLIFELIARHDLGVVGVGDGPGDVRQHGAGHAGRLLTALATKGETVAELRGSPTPCWPMRRAVRTPDRDARHRRDRRGPRQDRQHLLDGGARPRGCRHSRGWVKHGNRASSSASGSADLIEALGVSLTMPVEKVEEARAVGIIFLFANLFHPSMRFAAPTRRELGVATAFNVLGPLTNPGRPRSNAIGVSSARHAPLVAGVLAERGNSALVFRGRNGLDELTTTAVNEVWVVAGGEVRQAEFDATRLGLPASTVDDLRGADPAHNAAVAREVLAGAEGIVPDAVALNAAAGMVAHGLDGTREGTLEDRLAGGLSIAREVLRTGRAQDVLERWVAFSRSAG